MHSRRRGQRSSDGAIDDETAAAGARAVAVYVKAITDDPFIATRLFADLARYFSEQRDEMAVRMLGDGATWEELASALGMRQQAAAETRQQLLIDAARRAGSRQSPPATRIDGHDPSRRAGLRLVEPQAHAREPDRPSVLTD
jgi:hypothetical protein